MNTTVPRHFVKMFQPRFARLVLARKKFQTIRPVPVRMPAAGDTCSLREWRQKAYRSPQRKLYESVITLVQTIEICEDWRYVAVKIDGKEIDHPQCVELARADGFSCFQQMLDWFQDNHGLPFRGILIHWKELGE